MNSKKTKIKKVEKHKTARFKPRISLGLKLSVVFLFIVGASVMAFSGRALNLVKTEIRNQTLEDIRADSEFLVSSIKLWELRNESELLRITDPESSLANPIKTYFNGQQLESDKAPVRQILEKSLFNTANYLDLVVISPDSNEILIATNPNLEGKIGISESGVSNGKRSSPIFHSSDFDDFTMTIENPLKDETGKILAIIGVYINIHSLNPVLFSDANRKQSGQIYLTTPTGRAILGSFDINQETITYDPTRPRQIREYINHEGKLVLGYHEFLPDLQVTLLHEHEQSVLFAPLSELNRRIWTVAALVFIFSALISTFLIQGFLRPIKSLTKTAQKIAEGNYKVRGTAHSSDEIGVLNQVFNNMTDNLVSSLNEISYKNALLQSQYDAAPYGLASFNTKGELLSWNKTFIDVWKVPPALMQKGESKKLIDHCASLVKESETFIRKTVNAISSQRSSHDIIEMLDNSTIDRQSAPLLGIKGELLGKVFFCRDITREIEVNRTKNEFVSLATHQLQTPLTAIRWILEELITMEKGDKKKMSLVKDASDSTERVIQLVNDMLNVSRLDTGMIGVDSKRTELVSLLNELIKEANIPANKKEIEIGLKKSKNKIYASFDKSLISEVILNLLSNAIRFSESHKKVTISVKEEREYIEIKVKDSGIGISKKDQKELFTKFFRSDEAGKYNTTGSGLGLYVIKKILDACKGKIKIESKLGKGSTVTVQLPLHGPVNIKEGAHILIRKGIN